MNARTRRMLVTRMLPGLVVAVLVALAVGALSASHGSANPAVTSRHASSTQPTRATAETTTTTLHGRPTPKAAPVTTIPRRQTYTLFAQPTTQLSPAQIIPFPWSAVYAGQPPPRQAVRPSRPTSRGRTPPEHQPSARKSRKRTAPDSRHPFAKAQLYFRARYTQTAGSADLLTASSTASVPAPFTSKMTSRSPRTPHCWQSLAV